MDRPSTPADQPETDDADREARPSPETSFAQRGTFEGAYGEGSREAWQDEQEAQRAERPSPELSSGMGGSTTGYDPDTGFTQEWPAEPTPTE